MKIASNTVKSVIAHFRSELKAIYTAEEIAIFCFLCFEHFLGFRSPADLTLREAELMNESDLLKFSFALKDLKKRKPIQYILGRTRFYGLDIQVSPGVLIPRPETEELVELIRKHTGKNALRILDVGTGSGCIALALKKTMPQCEVLGLDVSQEALETAGQNSESNQTEVTFSRFDILRDASHWKGGNVDLIVSNPPYIRLSEKNNMDTGVTEYEPHLALFVENDDPLLFYRKILDFAAHHLRDEGTVYFEINEALGPEVIELMNKKGFGSARLEKDLNGKDRMAWGKKEPVTAS